MLAHDGSWGRRSNILLGIALGSSSGIVCVSHGWSVTLVYLGLSRAVWKQRGDDTGSMLLEACRWMNGSGSLRQ